jgi:hypothetical protein
MYKKGFKYMLDDVEFANKNLKQFRRGLSIFDDQILRKQLINKTDAPIFLNDGL